MIYGRRVGRVDKSPTFQICRTLGLFVFLLAIAALSWLFILSRNHNDVNFMTIKIPSDPSKFPIPWLAVKKGRILYLAPSYSTTQLLYLWKSLESWRDICEFGWDVDIALQVSNGWNASHPVFTEMQSSLFCHRIDRPITINITTFGDIGFGLNSQHRRIIQTHLQEYDYFAYGEEDMLFTVHNLVAYLRGMDEIRSMVGSHWMDYTVGFLRVEEHPFEPVRVTWEYLPKKVRCGLFNPLSTDLLCLFM